MVVVDIDHPDIEAYIDWKVKEEQKVAALVTGSKIVAKHLKAEARAPLTDVRARFAALPGWNVEAIDAAFKTEVTAQLKAVEDASQRAVERVAVRVGPSRDDEPTDDAENSASRED